MEPDDSLLCSQDIPKVKGKLIPVNRPWWPLGLWDIETFSRQSAHRWRYGCQPYAPSYPYNRPWNLIGLWDVEAPTFSRQSAHRWRWGCRPYAPAALCPTPPGRFLVPISVRGWDDPRVIVLLEGLGQLKKSSDLIGNRTRDLPACSMVPQPTTLPRTPQDIPSRINSVHSITLN
jgi:hypothetical protein